MIVNIGKVSAQTKTFPTGYDTDASLAKKRDRCPNWSPTNKICSNSHVGVVAGSTDCVSIGC